MARLVALSLLLGCAGRVATNETASATDAAPETDGSPFGSCEPVRNEPPCSDIPTYNFVDRARGCVDLARPALAACGCLKSAVDCWVSQTTGAVYVSPCTGPRLPGYCRCSEELYREVTRVPFCATP